MEREDFIVPNISCENCAATIKNAMRRLGGVVDVDIDVDTKTVSIDHHEITSREEIINSIRHAGYRVQE